MNIFQAVTTTRQVRKFTSQPVNDKLIGVMLHMATFAHSAGELQEWEFVVVDEDKIKTKLAKAALHQETVKDAPTVIVVCADLDQASLKYGHRGELLYALQDTGAATMLMVVTANALGLGTYWTGAFDDEEVKIILDLPDNLRPVALVAVGYPAGEGEPFTRISFEKITHYNRHNNKIFIEFEPIASALEKLIKKLAEKYKKPKEKKRFDLTELLKRLAD